MTMLQLAAPPPFSRVAANAAFARVLLGIDFGSASLGAARWATAHVAPDSDALLMHVMPYVDQSHRDDVAADSVGASMEQLTPAVIGGLGGFAATLDIASPRNLVRVGRPSECLAAVANVAEMPLLVLGRRADANRIRVGEPNVIERAARRTSASVLVVPEGTKEAPGHIVAAIDESRLAPDVLRVAARIARMHEAPLTVLHVLSPAVGAYERVIRSTRQLLTNVRGGNVKVAEPPPVPTSLAPSTARWLVELSRAHSVVGHDSTEVALGDPAREVVRKAMQGEAALVVAGMRGADEAPPGSIGSVARELLTRAPMPVLAVNAI